MEFMLTATGNMRNFKINKQIRVTSAMLTEADLFSIEYLKIDLIAFYVKKQFPEKHDVNRGV